MPGGRRAHRVPESLLSLLVVHGGSLTKCLNTVRRDVRRGITGLR
ncbi:hypothetical protein BSLA_03f0456 [Burkholderia stabilis]|nr:hypothetical protein BSLA_03f0456 [Burkholderia stabilis]